MNTSRALATVRIVLTLLAAPMVGAADAQPGPAGKVAAATTADGTKWTGRIVGDSKAGFALAAEGGGPSLPLERVQVVTFEGPEPGGLDGTPPFRVELGLDQALSGRLDRVDESTIRFLDGPGGRPFEVARAGAITLRTRPGEALVFLDGFEQWDEDRWTRLGDPRLSAEQAFEGRRSLALTAESAAVTHQLRRPVATGRLEAACYLDGRHSEENRWFVDLTFRGPGRELIPVRIVLGWSADGIPVETPEGPTLVVQRLMPAAGWHRLTVRFAVGERLDIALDGTILAHGQGPAGPLAEVRIASDPRGQTAPAVPVVGYVDDLKLFQAVQPPRTVEVDPTQDEARLLAGDQYFGAIRTADPRAIGFDLDGRPLRLDWSEVAALRFRRKATPGTWLDGLLIRAEWDAGPAQLTDQVEGVLAEATAAGLTIRTPYAGTLTVPTDRLRRLQVLGRGRRLVLDPGRHHLGDQYMATLDPPQAEGGILELPFTLAEVPPGEAAIVLDVIEVAGESPNLPFAEQIKNGELRTNLTVNGRAVDYLNRHIADLNETPTRIRLPLPPGLLNPGANRLRLDQVGKAKDPEYLDDLGILGIALEFADDEGPNP